MIGGWLLDGLLMVAVPALALASLLLRRVLPAIAAFIAYGLLLALVWMRLGAPDVALTEAAVGGGVTGVLLIGAATRLRLPMTEAIPGWPLRGLAGLLCLAVTSGLAVAVLTLPEVPPSLAPLAAANLPATELGNPVAGVLLAFRAIDTLLEAVVLVVAIIGIWSLAPDVAWGGRPGPAQPRLTDGPAALLASLLPPIGIVFGIYLAWVGAEEPGGAFQGGSILAAMWILAWLTGRVAPPRASSLGLRLLVVAGPVLFMLVGLAGFVIADGFMAYPEGWTKPVILLVEAALTLSIAVALCLIVAGWPMREARR
jgi:multisubunit Na+/H+ antiporter MnhB subunit